VKCGYTFDFKAHVRQSTAVSADSHFVWTKYLIPRTHRMKFIGQGKFNPFKIQSLLYSSTCINIKKICIVLQTAYLTALCDSQSKRPFCLYTALTLILLTWRIWWAPNNGRKWQMGFNSAFKVLKVYLCIWGSACLLWGTNWTLYIVQIKFVFWKFKERHDVLKFKHT